MMTMTSSSLIGAERNGAPFCRNQAVILSNPILVAGMVSNNLNIYHSVISVSAIRMSSKMAEKIKPAVIVADAVCCISSTS